MKIISAVWSLLFALLFTACGKDMSLEDYQRQELQQKLSRISAVSGSYEGEVTSHLDQQSLGSINLTFRASTDVRTSNTDVDSEQRAMVSGSLQLKSLSTADIAFDNGFYDDVTGTFQVTIPISVANGITSRISLNGHVNGDQWNGTIEVNGQSSFGATLQLHKMNNNPHVTMMSVNATRFEHLRWTTFSYRGNYSYQNETLPVSLSFIDRSLLPEQRLYRLFSPIRPISINLNFTDFELNFAQAILDDKIGTLVASDPTDQRGAPARATLQCAKFSQNASEFGWDCQLQTRTMTLNLHMTADPK